MYRAVIREAECPVLGVKRTSSQRASMSAFDPKRTSGALSQASASSVYVGDPTIDVFDPYQIRRNMRLDTLIPFAHIGETRNFPYPDFVELIVRSVQPIF
jgi:hypothetical protein